MPATCAVVGMVSPNRLLLEAHGNFNPTYDKALENAKVQFQLVSPTFHPEFDGDFKLAIGRIQALQGMVINEGPGAEHFIVKDGWKEGLKFSSPLFEKRVC